MPWPRRGQIGGLEPDSAFLLGAGEELCSGMLFLRSEEQQSPFKMQEGKMVSYAAHREATASAHSHTVSVASTPPAITEAVLCHNLTGKSTCSPEIKELHQFQDPDEPTSCRGGSWE